MKSWYISTANGEWKTKFVSYYQFKNLLKLNYLGITVEIECDKEQYFSAKEGFWTLVKTKDKHIEIVFK